MLRNVLHNDQAAIDLAYVTEGVKERCKELARDIAVLSKGTRFWKVRSGKDWYLRRYWLDVDHLCIRYEPSHKPCWKATPTHVDLAVITEVRHWDKNFFEDVYKQDRYDHRVEVDELDESLCFAIVIDDGREYNLIGPDEETTTKWIDVMDKIVSTVRAIHQENEYYMWLRKQFNKADKDKSGALDFKQMLTLLDLVNIKLPYSYAKQLFDTVNVNKKTQKGKQVLDVQEFIALVRLLTKRDELEELFKKYAKRNAGATMTIKELGKFLSKEQHQKLDFKQLEIMILTYEASTCKHQGLLTQSGFNSLMLSFGIWKEEHRTIFQDMNQPLSAYYIASSHNTYLTGNQLTSKSSVQAYISALEQGCRCVELDLWDGNHGDPVIYHGRTMTSIITLQDVLIHAIKPFAFKTSAYPVILSLESHLSAKQKRRLAFMLKDILGDLLYTDPVDESMELLPSPEQLKNKIIIKARKSGASDPLDRNDGDDEVDEDAANQSLSVDLLRLDDGTSEKRRSTQSTSSSKSKKSTSSQGSVVESSEVVVTERKIAVTSQECPRNSPIPSRKESTKLNNNTHNEGNMPPPSSSIISNDQLPQSNPVENSDANRRSSTNRGNSLMNRTDTKKSSKKKSSSASMYISETEYVEGAHELSDVVNLCQSVSFSGFYQNIKTGRCYQMSSLSELKADKLVQSDQAGLIEHTNHQLVRIYPKGSRTDSSNYDPVPFWNAGCQIVALNYQTNDLPKILNDAFFQVNGNCGYVLKPDLLRIGKPMPIKLVRIEIISGQNLPKSKNDKKDIIDPYVSIKIRGAAADKHKFKTKHIDDNGFNPVWNEATEFRLTKPELAVLVFTVKDLDTVSTDFIGWHVIPFTSLKPGYGHVRLVDQEGVRLPNATLFVRVTISDQAQECVS